MIQVGNTLALYNNEVLISLSALESVQPRHPVLTHKLQKFKFTAVMPVYCLEASSFRQGF